MRRVVCCILVGIGGAALCSVVQAGSSEAARVGGNIAKASEEKTRSGWHDTKFPGGGSVAETPPVPTSQQAAPAVQTPAPQAAVQTPAWQVPETATAKSASPTPSTYAIEPKASAPQAASQAPAAGTTLEQAVPAVQTPAWQVPETATAKSASPTPSTYAIEPKASAPQAASQAPAAGTTLEQAVPAVQTPAWQVPETATAKSASPTPSTYAIEPKASAPQAASQAPAAGTTLEDEVKAIDTMELEQPEGNWLNKRVWWERAKDKYKDVRIAFGEIFELRLKFFEKRSQLDRTLFGPFYQEIGVEEGALREVLTGLMEYIEKDREEEGYSSEDDREFLEKVSAAKGQLEQLKLDIDAISKIDVAVDKAITLLTTKVGEAHNFERSAWDEFETIAQELSDTRARQHYYVVDGLQKNLKDLRTYISGEFSTYFDNLAKTAQEKADHAKKTVQELKDRGIDLKEQAANLVEETREEEDDEEARRAAEEKAQLEAKKKAAEAAGGSLITRIFTGIVAFFSSAFKALWNALFGWWLHKRL